MEIPNFLYGPNKNKTNNLNSLRIIPCLLTINLFLSLGCQTFAPIETRRDENQTSTSAAQQGNKPDSHRKDSYDPNPNDDYEDNNENLLKADENDKKNSSHQVNMSGSQRSRPSGSNSPTPKVGVIIGPGFMRSFLSVGILQEFHKARVPIHALVGFEWGSLPAALMSMNNQPNEAEWQMLKLNESAIIKKSLMRNQIEAQSISELQDFLNQSFNRKTFEQNQISFECLAFDFKKKQYFWMKKGDLAKALPYCLASPPFTKPYLNNFGAVDLKLAVDNLKQKGANYIILINNLNPNKNNLEESFSIEAQILWSYHQYHLSKSLGLVDFSIDTSGAPYSMLDFNSRRDMIRKGQEIGAQALKKLSSKLGI